MHWLFMAELDPQTGDYEVEFRNIRDPGAGIEYDVMAKMLRRVLSDLDARMEIARARSDGEEVVMFGDEPVQ